jgi:cytidylate kinase
MKDVITISKQVGTNGDLIARRVAKLLNFQYFDKTVLLAEARRMGINVYDAEAFDLSHEYKSRGIIDSIFANKALISAAEEAQISLEGTIIKGLAEKGRIVIVGRGGQALLRNHPKILRVKIIAPVIYRIDKLMLDRYVSKSEAEKIIKTRDKATKQYLDRFYNLDWDDPGNYDTVLNLQRIPSELAPTYIAKLAREEANNEKA